jgi:lipopolysaccharide export system permease protein
MRLLDRYVLRHYFRAYAICCVCLVALYVIIDLFARIDEFTEHSRGVVEFFRNFLVYYGYRVPWFFQRLCGLVAILAAMFTLAWLERQNELVAWLAAGVPARRLLYPVLGATLAVLTLGLANRELLLPHCREGLQRTPDDPFGRKSVLVQGTYDANSVHVGGGVGDPVRQTVEIGRVTLPPRLVGALVHLNCAEMAYRPASAAESSGWYLRGTRPESLECSHPCLNWLGPGTYFLHTELDFERLTRRADWFHYEPTWSLLHQLEVDPQLPRRDEMIALVHRRLTTPLWEFILVLMALAYSVRRQDQNLYWKLGVNVVVNVAMQIVQWGCVWLAQQQYLDAALANWLPVLLFGPLALLLLEGMRT